MSFSLQTKKPSTCQPQQTGSGSSLPGPEDHSSKTGKEDTEPTFVYTANFESAVLSAGPIHFLWEFLSMWKIHIPIEPLVLMYIVCLGALNKRARMI